MARHPRRQFVSILASLPICGRQITQRDTWVTCPPARIRLPGGYLRVALVPGDSSGSSVGVGADVPLGSTGTALGSEVACGLVEVSSSSWPVGLATSSSAVSGADEALRLGPPLSDGVGSGDGSSSGLGDISLSVDSGSVGVGVVLGPCSVGAVLVGEGEGEVGEGVRDGDGATVGFGVGEGEVDGDGDGDAVGVGDGDGFGLGTTGVSSSGVTTSGSCEGCGLLPWLPPWVPGGVLDFTVRRRESTMALGWPGINGR